MFKFNNLSCFVLPAHMDFTHLALSLLAAVPAKLKSNPDCQCLISSEVHHLQLKFAFFLFFFLTLEKRLENPTVNNYFQIWWISETRRLVSTLELRLRSLILSPRIRQSEHEARCWTLNIPKTVTKLTLKRKKVNTVINAKKKVITGPCHFCLKPGSGTLVLNLGIQKLSTKILGCLPSPHST